MKYKIHHLSCILIPILISILIAVFFTGCGQSPDNPGAKNPSLSPLDVTFLRQGNQSVITPEKSTANNWSGFEIKDGCFVPSMQVSKFILWREKAENTTIFIQYTLRGKHVDVMVNSQNAFKLKPRYKEDLIESPVQLSRGFNFIEFRQQGKCDLKIKSLTVGSPPDTQKTDPDPHAITHSITQNNVFSRFFPPGKGMIRLQGKGRVAFKKVEFNESDETDKTGKSVESMEKTAENNQVEYSFVFNSPGFLRLSVLSGQFASAAYSFEKLDRPLPPNPLKVRVKEVFKQKPHVYIFLIDGCHADHLGVYGYHRDTSPHIDGLAKDAVVFENAYANATFTRSSVASIFTGFHPHRHKLRILTNRLPKGLFMMPEFFRNLGYKTALLTEAGNISKVYGFDQGVDNYQKVFRRWNHPRYLENNMFKFLSQWLETRGSLFTYVHFRAPHFPIVPPPPFLDMYKKKENKGQEDRLIFRLIETAKAGHHFTAGEIQDVIDDYDSTIRYVDSLVGQLIEELKKKGTYDSSMIIFTSDHGEALYEHGAWGHGHNVYPGAARVPLIVKFPAAVKTTGRVERVVQLVDLFPTFAGLFNEKRFFDGRDLLDSIQHREMDDTPAFSTTFGMPPSIGIRWRSWYYIIHLFNNSEELFHLTSAPRENVSAVPENKDLTTFFRSMFLSWYVQFDRLDRGSQSIDLKKLPREEYENLKSLGYIQ